MAVAVCQVDVVIQAHQHDYERTLPVNNLTAAGSDYQNPRAPVYVVNGAAGNREKTVLCRFNACRLNSPALSCRSLTTTLLACRPALGRDPLHG